MSQWYCSSETDPLGPARAVVLTLPLGILLWAVIGLVAYRVLS